MSARRRPGARLWARTSALLASAALILTGVATPALAEPSTFSGQGSGIILPESKSCDSFGTASASWLGGSTGLNIELSVTGWISPGDRPDWCGRDYRESTHASVTVYGFNEYAGEIGSAYSFMTGWGSSKAVSLKPSGSFSSFTGISLTTRNSSTYWDLSVINEDFEVSRVAALMASTLYIDPCLELFPESSHANPTSLNDAQALCEEGRAAGLPARQIIQNIVNTVGIGVVVAVVSPVTSPQPGPAPTPPPSPSPEPSPSPSPSPTPVPTTTSDERCMEPYLEDERRDHIRRGHYAGGNLVRPSSSIFYPQFNVDSLWLNATDNFPAFVGVNADDEARCYYTGNWPDYVGYESILNTSTGTRTAVNTPKYTVVTDLYGYTLTMHPGEGYAESED